ncbi:hypothetical protein [Roseateles sp.]|mgnify:CR=1 FL=1|uniref:hypothetical protein n=1 Tax=Roseateles sp. TaxID=1971397 RepID=UPI00394F0A3C
MALDLDLFDFSPDAFVTDGAVPAQIEQAEATAADNARRRALELQAQACNNAADACWYLARSLGAARDLPPGEASMELLFQLIGALADLPAEIASAALPEVVGGRDDGIAELCHQLEAARESAEDALIEAKLAAPRAAWAH